MALSRDSSTRNYGYGGVMEIGGVPDGKAAGMNASSSFVTTGLQILSQQWINPLKPAYQFYAITPDGLSYKGATGQKGIQYIVDSGTTLMYVPTADAAAINALFVPPAQLEQGNWLIECSAKPPQVGVRVNGTVLPINPVDLVYKITENGTTCQSGIQDGGTGPYILGDVFMVNTLSVIDVGNLQMRFSSRQYYA
ncbi:acid protease [Mollisia scopiformis]|uniref:Acid protease n=1 Tax=Mollisia scopiformis TaxID=149040 RepID=A0A194XW45_MOLSC|nr:acid protease [Mollisia scopiformis]KUJ24356.1 acid protease [Mollisia scopiformis]